MQRSRRRRKDNIFCQLPNSQIPSCLAQSQQQAARRLSCTYNLEEHAVQLRLLYRYTTAAPAALTFPSASTSAAATAVPSHTHTDSLSYSEGKSVLLRRRLYPFEAVVVLLSSIYYFFIIVPPTISHHFPSHHLSFHSSLITVFFTPSALRKSIATTETCF